MPTADPDLAQELHTVERARAGDHDAFVALYRQDAPPAWRLGLALTADPDRAADAVARAFARTLAPLRAGATRTEVPFRLRLLAATRQVVLDLGTLGPSPVPALASLRPATVHDDELDDVERSRRRAAEVLQAFHQLPERWRTILWLHAVEGIGTDGAAMILAVPASDAEELAERASAGLHTQWARDRADAGQVGPEAPEHLERRLQPVLPLPLDLFAAAEAHWRATRRASAGPLRLVLPGGRPLPLWAERSLLGGTAALIALGITSALAVDRDPDLRRTRAGTITASGPTTTTEPPREPQAYLDGEDGSLLDAAGPVTAKQGSSTARAAAPVMAAASGIVTAATTTSTPTSTAPPTTVAPVLEVTAGVGHVLGLSVGDSCTGLEVLGQIAGCAPATDDGVTLDAGGSLLDS